MNNKSETKRVIGYLDPNVEIAVDVFRERVHGTISRLLDIVYAMGLDIEKNPEHPAVATYLELHSMLNESRKYVALEEVEAAEDRLREIKKYCVRLREELK